VHVDGNQCLETEIGSNLEGKLGDKTGKIIDDDGERNSEIEKHGDPLEGLVDPWIYPEVNEADGINEEPTVTSNVDLDANVSEKEHLKHSQKELVKDC